MEISKDRCSDGILMIWYGMEITGLFLFSKLREFVGLLVMDRGMILVPWD